MKVLVTGGAGFIGANLVRRLLLDGFEVTVLDDLSTGHKKNLEEVFDKITFLEQDVEEEFDGEFDIIFNLACPASPKKYVIKPVKTMKTNFLGTLNVLELALKTGAKVLHASTSEIYGDALVHPQHEEYLGNVNTVGPRSCYDEGKRIAESLCFEYFLKGVDVRVVRIFNTYGPYMDSLDGRVVSNFILQALNGEDITIYGNGSQTRSFQFVDDLVEVFMLYVNESKDELLAKFKDNGWVNLPILNTGNPGEFTIKELAEKVISLTNSNSKLVYLELPQDDPKQRRPDITLAKNILGWQPKIQLDEGLKKTIKYFKELL